MRLERDPGLLFGVALKATDLELLADVAAADKTESVAYHFQPISPDSLYTWGHLGGEA